MMTAIRALMRGRPPVKVLVLGALVGIAAALLGITLVRLAGDDSRRAAGTRGGSVHIVFADPTDTRVSEVMDALVQQGYVPVSSSAELEDHVGAGTRIVVLTRASFSSTPKSLLASIYHRGILVAALDVSMGELAPALSGGEPGTSWLPYSLDYRIYSLMFRRPCGSGASSDILNARAFMHLLEVREPETAVAAPPSEVCTG